MKKWRSLGALLLAAAVLASGCGSGAFRDDQVYIVNRGDRASEKKELVNWLSVHGPDPFLKTAWPRETLGEGEIPLYYDKSSGRIYFMRATELLGPEGEYLAGGVSEWVDIFMVRPSTGERTMIATDVPFVTRVIPVEKSGRLYLFGGGALGRIDLRRNEYLPEEEAMRAGTLTDVFVAPLENGKLYLNVAGLAGGNAYYPDSGRSVSLYQTKDRLYYKAVLEKPYYYATEWRSDEDEAGELWSVVADQRENVVRFLAEGAFSDAFGKGVLLLGANDFALRFIPDVNVPEKALLLTQDYVYDCGFLPGGRIYWVGDDGERDGGFRLHLLNAKGVEERSLAISGAALFVDERGRYGYSNGPAQEEIDLQAGEVLRHLARRTPLAWVPTDLQETLRGALEAYARYSLGDRSAEAAFAKVALSPEVAESVLAPPATDDPEGGKHVQMKVDDVAVSYDGQRAEAVISLLGLSESGRSLAGEVHLQLVQSDGWRIAAMQMENKRKE